MSVSRFYIHNVTCINADTEYSQQLSSFCSKFMIKPRTPEATIRLYESSGGSDYWTIFGGSADEYVGPFPGARTIYFQSDTAGAVVEIIEV